MGRGRGLRAASGIISNFKENVVKPKILCVFCVLERCVCVFFVSGVLHVFCLCERPDREQVDCEREKVEVRDKEKGDKTRTNNARSNM